MVVHPAIVLIAAGLVLPLTGRARPLLMLAAPLAALALVVMLPEGSLVHASWLGLALEPLKVDVLARLFGVVFCLVAFAGALYARRQPSTTELSAALVYAGGALGVTFAGDLISLFVFWEAMALASALVIWSAGQGAYGAGMRYLGIHLLGGVLLIAGIGGHVAATGSIAIVVFHADSLPHWLMLAGVLINAGVPPLSAWVADAYPKASWSGMVFLSAFTTKAAVLVLIRMFPGEPSLIWLGAWMIVYGLVYAMFASDLRRMFAYSIVGQVGFMVAAVGIGSPSALAAAAAHAFAHIFYKALLLMAAGSVLKATGTTDLRRLGGLARKLPVTAIAALVGAAAISGLPLTSGFVTKSLIGDAVGPGWLGWLLTAAAAGTFFYAAAKQAWYVFLRPNPNAAPVAAPPDLAMNIAMLLLAAGTLAIGLWPPLLTGLLPVAPQSALYTPGHVGLALGLPLLAAAAFALIGRRLPMGDRLPDFDWFWRRGGAWFVRGLSAATTAISAAVGRWTAEATARLGASFRRHYGPASALARTWSTGRMAFWMAGMLALYLLLQLL